MSASKRKLSSSAADDDDFLPHRSKSERSNARSKAGREVSPSPPNTFEDSSVDAKKQALTEWVAKRLLEHSWYNSVKESFAAKLSTYQNNQLTGNEKKVIDDLIREIASGVRASIPDTIKKDLVNAVQDYLINQPDDVLRQFRPQRSSKR